MQTPINIAIADDYVNFLDLFKHELSAHKQFKLMYEAYNGKSLAGKMRREGLPDVVLLDAKMEPWDGIDTTIYIRNNYPSVKVIALTLFDNEHYVIEMMRAGASAFLFKNEPFEHILHTIIKVYEGSYSTSPSPFSLYVLEGMYNNVMKSNETSLSHREKEVLRLICRQHSTDEIADIMSISSETVHGHRKKLMQKTGSRNVVGLATFAHEHGIV